MSTSVSPRTSGAFVGGLGGASLIGAADSLLAPFPTLKSAAIYIAPFLSIWATVAYAAFIVWFRGRVERHDVKRRIERFRSFVDEVEKAGKGSQSHLHDLRSELEELERLYAQLERSDAYAMSRAFATLERPPSRDSAESAQQQTTPRARKRKAAVGGKGAVIDTVSGNGKGLT